jgi:hypothetical protein
MTGEAALFDAESASSAIIYRNVLCRTDARGEGAFYRFLVRVSARAILVASVLSSDEPRRIMFPVEISIPEGDEDALTARMTAMREWLDRRRVEPSRFHYTVTAPGILFRVDFSVEAAAIAFAREFGGHMIGAVADISPQAAEPHAAD